jgi:ribosomal protein S18 acetylase RimI-like enzyme
MTEPGVRQAGEADLVAVKRLADGCKSEIGFISRGMLCNASGRGELLVAALGDEVVGFVDFHRRRDGQITIYGIVVAPEVRCRGIGRALVAALVAEPLPARLALKCPTDNPANGFYAALGFQCVGVEAPTKRRPLNLWVLEGGAI